MFGPSVARRTLGVMLGGPPITPAPMGPFGTSSPVTSFVTAIAPATVAALILALPTDHPHVLHHDPISITTEAAVAFVAILVAICLILQEYRKRDRPEIPRSDMPAYANGQRYVSKGGRERERFSDPDASWGHRSAVSTREGGGFYGYKIHAAICANTDLPVAWRIETARRHESLYVAPLLNACRARGFRPETCAMDRGYDHNRVMDETRERGCIPIVALRKGRPIPLSTIPHGSPEWKRLYRGRAAVERTFGLLKHDYGLAPLRVRGLARVQLHADLTMLARLGQALSRARAVPLAA